MSPCREVVVKLALNRLDVGLACALIAPMESSATVFIVDDSSAARESLAAMLKARGVVVQTYASAKQFLADVDRISQGCLIVDVRMPGMTGLELQQQLQANGILLAVIMVTGHGDVQMAVRAMQAGAVAYLEKPCQQAELWRNVELALEKNRADHEAQRHRAAIRSRLEQLTADELTVLELMLEGKPNKTIAGELDIGLRTVELRRSNVMKKMQADSLAELVRMALSVEFMPRQSK